MEAVAVLRDTSNGECYLVTADDTDAIDIERVNEGGYEVAGWLRYPRQAEQHPNTDEQKRAPLFTTCEHDIEGGTCERLILLIDDMAPEFCTEHEN